MKLVVFKIFGVGAAKKILIFAFYCMLVDLVERQEKIA